MAKSNGGASPSAILDTMQPEAIRVACTTATEQLRDLSQAWFASVNRMVDSSWELATQLPKCADVSDAAQLYTSWLNGRQETIMADTKALSDLWLKCCKVDSALMVPARMYSGAAQGAAHHRMSAVPSAPAAE